MKNKHLKLSLLVAVSALSLSGCSFLEEIASNINTPDPVNPSDPSNPGGSTEKDPNANKRVTNISAPNRRVDYEQYDTFAMPTTIVAYEDGTTADVTKLCTLEGGDTSFIGDSDVAVAYQNKVGKYTLRFQIKVHERADYHFDDVEDDITTLEIKEVVKDYLVGDDFKRPLIYAVHKDGTRTDITTKAEISGYNMSIMNFYKVQIYYSGHIICYFITVQDLNEVSQYPMKQGGFCLNEYNHLSVIDEKFALKLMERDGFEETYYGIGDGHFIKGTTYRSDDESIAEISSQGLVTAKKAGSTFVYVDVPDIYGNIHHSFRCKIVVEEKQLISFELDNLRTQYFTGSSINVSGSFTATYQNGYSEKVYPEYDLSKVNQDVPGDYEINISYTINGVTKTITETIHVLDASLYKVEKTKMGFDLNDYNINSSVPVTALPLEGELNSLVVPVRFDDSTDYITNFDNVVSDINDCFFGNETKMAWRSVKSYYEEESFGKITFNGKVTEIFDTHHNASYYAESGEGSFNSIKREVLDWYFTNHPEEDIKDYDVDHDGFFDGLNLVYLYPDYKSAKLDGDEYGGFWGMVRSSRDEVPDINKPVADRYFWTSYDFMYSKKDVALARTGKSDVYQGGDPEMTITPRAFIHENGHMFGIDDYYSYTEDAYFAGHANMQTLNMLGHDPYSLLLWNWAEPYIPQISTTITIKDFQTSHDVILLSPEWNLLDSPFDEYFLIDLYVPDSGLNYYDAKVAPKRYTNEMDLDYLDQVGIRLWHVDGRLATKASAYKEFTLDPTVGNIEKICDNSRGRGAEALQDYDHFLELQLIRNKENYDYNTSGYLLKDEYFLEGDSFNMNDFSTQFVNGNKMDKGVDLGWSFTVEGIYYDPIEGWSADIKVIKG